MTNDSQRLESAVLLLGHALLATLAVLERENLLSDVNVNPRIPNISLIVAAFFRWVVPMENIDLEEPVFGMILRLMEKHNMEIDGFYDMDFMDKVEEEVDLSDSQERKVNNNVTSKDKFNYGKEVCIYRVDYDALTVMLTSYLVQAVRQDLRYTKNWRFSIRHYKNVQSGAQEVQLQEERPTGRDSSRKPQYYPRSFVRFGFAVIQRVW